MTPDVVSAEKSFEKKWSSRPAYMPPPDAQDDGGDVPDINVGAPPPLPPRKHANPNSTTAGSGVSSSVKPQPPALPPRLPPRYTERDGPEVSMPGAM